MIDNAAEVVIKIKEIQDFDLKLRLIAVANLVDQRKALDKQQENEVRVIEKKFDQITLPFTQSSNDIINGVRAVKEEEITKLDEYLTESEKVTRELYVKNQDAIAGYWLKAIKNAQPLQEDVKPKDEPILSSLKKVEAENDPENDNFTLTFTFDENEFFTNDVLRIKYFVKDEQEILKTECTPINWKEGKDITVKLIKKKKNKKLKVKEVEQESFFNIFKSLDTTTEEFKLLPKEKQSEVEFKIGVQFEVGSIIQSELIPFSLEYYLGVKVDDEFDEEDDQDEEDEEEEDDEDISKEEAIQRMKARFQPKKK